MIGIIDYGAGNLCSVENAMDHLGFEARRVSGPDDLAGLDRLILPGVGHFGMAVRSLHQSGLFPALAGWLADNKPFLGICLGLQLLFQESEEDGFTSPGLGFFNGRVVKLGGPRKLHIGWAEVQTRKAFSVPQGFYYFVHGFLARPDTAGETTATAMFGEMEIPAALERGRVLGVQFHPEKSGASGLELIKRWGQGSFQPAVRLIPCLDVDDGRVVKGVQFSDLREAGDPVCLARRYYEQGADEITFLDVGASWKSRQTLLGLVQRVSREVFVPLCVGGGLRSVDDIRQALRAGADKVSLCTAAVENPGLIAEAAERFGSQCLVLSVDAKRRGRSWIVCTHGGRREHPLDALEWASRGQELGAGEILLNSIDRDGTGAGYDLELLRRVRSSLSIPVIASGGAGEPGHLLAAVRDGRADAVLLASRLHFGGFNIPDLKNYLRAKGVELR